MRRRSFLQYIGLGSFIGFPPLCKTSQNITNKAKVNDSHNHHLDKLSALKKKYNLNENYTFDNFVIGESNDLPVSVALQVSESPNKAYNPFYIYGQTGLGKTHLMHALGNRMLELNPDARIMYIHSERFVSQMVKALANGTLDEFREIHRSLDALLIDDIQFFAGKDRSQTEILTILDYLMERGSQIVLTGDRHSYAIEGLDERLRSLMGWALTLYITAPEKTTRLAIAHKKASEYDIELPSEVAIFITHHFRSNIRKLEGALRRVVVTANFSGKPIALDLTKDALKDLTSLKMMLNKKTGVNAISYRNKFVSSYYNGKNNI